MLSAFESFAGMLVARGLYFYTDRVYEASIAANLWLALVLGVAYVAGAWVSHPLAHWLGERQALLLVCVGQLVAGAAVAGDAWLAATPSVPLMVVGSVAIWVLHGATWPIVESYVSAGRDQKQTANALGWFNLAWAGATAPAVAFSGTIIEWHPAALFGVASAAQVLVIGLTLGLRERPLHLTDDHPDRPTSQTKAHYQRLLTSAQWSMLSTYILLFMLAPMMPAIFKDRLGYSIAAATVLASTIEGTRFITFFVLQRSQFWHGRADLLVGMALAIPVCFFMVLLGQGTATVVIGASLFGLAEGLAYYAALYYIMLVKNSSVDAGGEHEGLIGMGYALGPAAGLVGQAAVPKLGVLLGPVVGIAPVILLCLTKALAPIVRDQHIQSPK